MSFHVITPWLDPFEEREIDVDGVGSASDDHIGCKLKVGEVLGILMAEEG